MRSVVVTGASSGIGGATALRLSRKGWRVYSGVRNGDDAPEGTTPLVFDVTDAGAIAAAVERVREDTDALHGLVNNAGITVPAPLEFLPLDELREQLEVNVIAQLGVTQAFLPMLRAGRGRIVNMGSISGRSALPFLGAYAASKFALEALTDSLRVELAPFGVHVSIVEPGTIATPIWRKGAERADRIAERMPPRVAELYGPRIEAFRRAAAARGAQGASPDDVAAAVEHALSSEKPKARYLVGKDAKLRARVQHLPTGLRDRLLTRKLLNER
jgi:NAD(P)-dependent dehydrogenase (short-subunit alcohol dehydrogenase family)